MSDKRLAFPIGPCECELQEVNVVERKKMGQSEMWCKYPCVPSGEKKRKALMLATLLEKGRLCFQTQAAMDICFDCIRCSVLALLKTKVLF